MIRPLYNRVLLKQVIEETRSDTGIVLLPKRPNREFAQRPDQTRRWTRSVEAVVVSVGPGKHWPIDLKPGDRVLISERGGSEVEVEGEDHLIAREDEIQALLVPEDEIQALLVPDSAADADAEPPAFQ